MNVAMFRLTVFLIRLAALFPLSFLYRVSGFLYCLVYHVLCYRRKIVSANLKNSFPEKDRAEIKKIEKGFYRHFCDVIVETLKMLTISSEELKARVTYKNMEVFDKYYEEGKHVVALMSHYGNWEWMSGFPLVSSFRIFSVYKPLKSKVFDQFMLNLRGRFGCRLVPFKRALRHILSMRKSCLPSVTAFIADQSPVREGSYFITRFLEQDTPFHSGLARIAKLDQYAFVFMKMQKRSRGYYEVEVVDISSCDTSTQKNEALDLYVKHLESQIKEKPEYWLWSHRRWKEPPGVR